MCPRRPRSTREARLASPLPSTGPMDISTPDAAHLVPVLEPAVHHLPTGAIPALIGDLERLQALLWARLLREAQAGPGTRAASALEDLQHLTPALGDIVPSIE